jgi:hypothetical protein
MANLILFRSRPSARILVIVGIVFGLVLIVVLAASFLLATRTRESMLAHQSLKSTVPQVATKRQVKRIFLERETENGIEYIEILANGTINVYDLNHKLIKTGLQGFSRINSLFDDIDRHWDTLFGGSKGKCRLTIETNFGITVIDCGGSSGGGGTGEDIIDDIEEITDNTFEPTPTFAPTSNPAPTIPWPTDTPWPTYLPTPNLSITPGGPTPTPLPGYMTAPPFRCEDYKLNHPFAISNVICGLSD